MYVLTIHVAVKGISTEMPLTRQGFSTPGYLCQFEIVVIWDWAINQSDILYGIQKNH